MMMGPEPMIRILEISARLGIRPSSWKRQPANP
jgi:hypothetical protein